VPDITIQERYFAWLASQVSPEQLSELYVIYAEIEEFCLKRRIITKKLFELDNLSDIHKVVETVDSNRVFRFTYKRRLSKMSSAMRFYYRFTKENPTIVTHSASAQESTNEETVTRKMEDPTPVAVLSETERLKLSKTDVDKVVDFTVNESFTFTQPTEFSYFGERQAKVSSWTQLYVQVVCCLYEDYPGSLKAYINHNIGGQGRPDFTDEDGVESMTAPKKVADNFYLESNISATDILKKVRRLLDLCNVDYENLVIHYQKKDRPESDSDLVLKGKNSETSKADISPDRVQFIDWMKQSGAVTSTIFSYLSAIGRCSKTAREYGICDTDLWLIQEADRLTEIKTSLLNVPSFRELNTQQHNRFQAALTKLIAFRSAMSTQSKPVEGKRTVDDAIRTGTVQQIRFSAMQAEHSTKEEPVFALLNKHRIQYVDQRKKGGCLWIIGGHELDSIVDQCHRLGFHFKYKAEGSRSTDSRQAWWTKSFLEPAVPQITPTQLQPANIPATNAAERCGAPAALSEERSSCYAAILSEYFGEDGYQPGRAIFRGRFKRYYAEKFGCDPVESDENIDAILSMVGAKRGDRIFPKQDHQDDLITNIINDIMTAFKEGTTAVYIEAVFDKYQRVLVDSLQIYDQDALGSLLVARAKGRYVRKRSFLETEQAVADPAADLLRIMKSFHQPQDYIAIHEKAWFIPYDKMKSLLVSIRSIVNIAPETYFYAPNLPISAEELRQLTGQIYDVLSYHGYMTDVKLMCLIEEKFPSIAINTEGFTAYGLRNCLGYILRNQFVFNGPIISLKGKELSMGDVYAEFSREHETLQLDDLTAFSSEMNVGIYWDSVLIEMIRVSVTEFVRKDLINFDVDAIDAVLEEICPGGYVPMKDITLFLLFPNIGYPWNSYLLESYLFNCSRDFRLIHSSFTKTGVYGAMVRMNSDIQDYRSLLVDVLSRSDALNSPKEALQYIVDQGYQQRRRYEGIETLIQEAKLKKDQRERQEK